jgi:hypothetical protein
MGAFLVSILGLSVAVILESFPSELRRSIGVPAVATSMLGFYVATIAALRGYAHWTVRRVYEVGISPPSLSLLRAERRRASVWAGAMVGAVVLAIMAMVAIPIRGWASFVVGGLFVGGCAAGVHFLQVWSTVRTIEPLCVAKE